MASEITCEQFAKYEQLTAKALALAQAAIRPERHAAALEALDMVQRYLDDARHFAKGGDLVLAFAAINYAHGWLDCGARTGLFDVRDSRLFCVDGTDAH